MTTSLVKSNRKPARKAKRYTADKVLGVELCSSGEVVVNGKSYGDGEGFVLNVLEGAVAMKLPFLPAVFFALSSGSVFALHNNKNAGKWSPQTKALVPIKKRQALPRKSWFYWITETLAERSEQSYFLPLGRAYPLSPSLGLLPGGLIEYTPKGGKTVQVPVNKIPANTGDIELVGLSGKHVLKGIGQDRVNLHRVSSRWQERFEYRRSDDCWYRHAVGRFFASGERDEYWITYLKTGEVVLGMAPVAYRMRADGKPWSIDLPDGSRVKHSEAQYLTIYDPKKNINQRFCRADGKWLTFDTGQWHIDYPWVLDGAKGFSTTVCGGVLELFADGTCRFLNQYQFSEGSAIDVTGPNNLQLLRVAGSQFLDVFENGDHIGSGYYHPQVFCDKDGNWSSGWGWGTETEFPFGKDRSFEVYVAWAAIPAFAIYACYPGEVLLFGLAAIIAIYVMALVLRILKRLFNLFAPGFAPLVRLGRDAFQAAMRLTNHMWKKRGKP